MAMSVGQSVYHFGQGGNISTPTEWIAMIFFAIIDMLLYQHHCERVAMFCASHKQILEIYQFDAVKILTFCCALGLGSLLPCGLFTHQRDPVHKFSLLADLS